MSPASFADAAQLFANVLTRLAPQHHLLDIRRQV